MGINPAQPRQGMVSNVCSFFSREREALYLLFKKTSNIALNALNELKNFINEHEDFILGIFVFHLQDFLFPSQNLFPSLATAFTLGAASAIALSSIKRIYEKFNQRCSL